MNTNIVLKGKKVILRPLSLKDAKRFCDWLGDTEVTKFLTIHNMPKPSLAEEKAWIKKARIAKKQISFAVDSIDGTHIGSCSMRNIDSWNKNAELGIMIGDKKYWGQGFGTEAMSLLVKYGFDKLKLNSIYLHYIAFNVRALKSYKKVGFRVTGRYRQHVYSDGHFHDSMVMDILREEYLKKYKIPNIKNKKGKK